MTLGGSAPTEDQSWTETTVALRTFARLMTAMYIPSLPPVCWVALYSQLLPQLLSSLRSWRKAHSLEKLLSTSASEVTIGAIGEPGCSCACETQRIAIEANGLLWVIACLQTIAAQARFTPINIQSHPDFPCYLSHLDFPR
jgi:hypothetical protein